MLRIVDDDEVNRGGQPETLDGGQRHGPLERGLVRPRDFADSEPIGSIVFLRNRRGPLIAFGPRLDPVRAGGIDQGRAGQRA